MADNPYGKAKKGENASQKEARQKKFYSYQREHAEETGDQATTDKIYKKLGKKSHSVDADAVNKGILGGVASTFGLGGLGRFGKVAGAAGKAMRGMRAARTVGRGAQEYEPKMARRLGTSSGPKPGQKALTGGKGPKMAKSDEPIVMGGKKAPGSQNKPIYKRGGVTPRAGKSSGAMGKMKSKSASKMKKKAS